MGAQIFDGKSKARNGLENSGRIVDLGGRRIPGWVILVFDGEGLGLTQGEKTRCGFC